MFQGHPTIPEPPPVPDVPMIVTGDDLAKIVAFSMFALVFIVWFISHGPIGKAIGEVISRLFGGSRAPKELGGELEQLRSRVEGLERQLGELAERQDFAERMLAQARRDKVLPGAGDVPR
jgi:hypothetical protein